MTNASVFGDIAVQGSLAVQNDLHVGGIIYAATLNVDTINAKKLCLGQTCVNEDQLKDLLKLLDAQAVDGKLDNGFRDKTEEAGGNNKTAQLRAADEKDLLPLVVALGKGGGQSDKHHNKNYNGDSKVDNKHIGYEFNDLVNATSHSATIQQTTASAAPTKKDQAWNLPKIVGSTTEANNTVPTSLKISDSLASKTSESFGNTNLMRHNNTLDKDVLSNNYEANVIPRGRPSGDYVWVSPYALDKEIDEDLEKMFKKDA
jgi:hypothetical protein